jgi:hypothetical protein
LRFGAAGRADGHAITLHRTYLHGGRKAKVRNAKKLLSAGINSAAVRLFQATEELAIAEGVETALSVYLASCNSSDSFQAEVAATVSARAIRRVQGRRAVHQRA